MLAWFGAYQLEPTTARQHMVMFALVPSLRRRFIFERQLDGSVPSTHTST